MKTSRIGMVLGCILSAMVLSFACSEDDADGAGSVADKDTKDGKADSLASTTCKPICDAVGSRSEGWYDSCSKKLIGWSPCKSCEAKCDAIGSRSEGWYDTCGKGVNGSGLITWADCDKEEVEEPKNCKPVCFAVGTSSEGWVDNCTWEVIDFAKCAGCEAKCDAIGSRSEGWYDTCGKGVNGSGLITWADCDKSELPGCPDTGVLCDPDCPASGSMDGAPCKKGIYDPDTCVCEPVDEGGKADDLDEPCKPRCFAVGTSTEGWVDGCTFELIDFAKCEGCEAKCDAVGSRSEGWYDSCGKGINGTGLITWADCDKTK